MLRPQYKVEEARHFGAARVLTLVGLPSITTRLHLARLRHLLSCVAVSIKEFWALAHAEGTWLCLERESLCWLRDLLVPGPDGADWSRLWPCWLEILRRKPGSWKRMLRKAQARAVRREAWQSSFQGHRGLLSRQLQTHGGLLVCSPPPEWDRKYCCAPCGKVFASRQHWSVHAFKSHGRLAKGRGLLEGRQCQSCLRHFGTNLKLCKHLEYSRDCRHKLCSAGYSCDPLPGQGHRSVEDAGGSQAPVLQAEGPALPPQELGWLDATARPVAEILDCLSHVCDGVAELSEAELWRRLHMAFSCVCAETDRLRLTAEAFVQHLRQSHSSSASMDGLVLAVEWIASSDIVDWLVPAPAEEPVAHTTFRDSELVLGMMEVSHISFPVPVVDRSSCAWIVVGPGPWCASQERSHTSSVCYTIEECLQMFSRGSRPAFFDGPFDSVGFLLCVDAWMGFQPLPDVLLPAKAFPYHFGQRSPLWGFGATCPPSLGAWSPCYTLFPDLI